MEQIQPYSLAFSSCPNDTFIFKGIARNLIPSRGMRFSIALEDVETLNKNAAREKYDITKLSFAALGKLLDRYALLRTGAALGMGCGPLIVSCPGQNLGDSKSPVVAVPGLGTTAYHLFRFFLDDLFPDISPEIIPMPFEQVMPAIVGKRADFGVIIHEGRFVFKQMGLALTADLGQWWEDKTKLPIPLGCIAIRREMDANTARKVETLIRDSIDHGFLHPDMENDYIQIHAQEMDPKVIRQHINLYVNEFSRDIGEKGEAAVTAFFDHAVQAGLMEKSNYPLFPEFG